MLVFFVDAGVQPRQRQRVLAAPPDRCGRPALRPRRRPHRQLGPAAAGHVQSQQSVVVDLFFVVVDVVPGSAPNPSEPVGAGSCSIVSCFGFVVPC